MNRQMRFLGLLLVAMLTACGETASPPKPTSTAPTKTTAPEGVGPGDLRLGMSAEQMLGTQFIKSAAVYRIVDDTHTANKTNASEIGTEGDCVVNRFDGMRIVRCELGYRLTLHNENHYRKFSGTANYALPVQDALALPKSEWLFNKELFGEPHDVKVSISDGKVRAIGLQLGPYTKEKLKNVFGVTAERYKMVEPSAAELEDFNAGRKLCAAWVDDSTRVALTVRTNNLANSPMALQAQVLGADLSPQISVAYNSPEQMQQLIKECGPSALIKGEKTKL